LVPHPRIGQAGRMRYVIFGAGAIGGGIGGLLTDAGRDVTLIARGPHLAAMQADGLQLRSPGGDRCVKVHAVGNVAAAEIGAGDVVILATKSQDTGPALAELTLDGHPDLVVLCAQNGVDNERQALRTFPRVYGMCVMMPATHVAPGEVRLDSEGYPGVLDVGLYPSGVDATAEAIAEDLRAAGFGSMAQPAVMRRKYRKLLRNLGNVLDAAMVPSSAHYAQLQALAAAEALELFAAVGIDVETEEEETARRMNLQVRRGRSAGESGSSTWQSLVRGSGSIENDYLNGEVVLIARLHGRRAPVNEVLWQLGHRVVRDRLAPRSVDPAEIVGAIAGAG
jgi:2-dehydropantoate 2-reductase